LYFCGEIFPYTSNYFFYMVKNYFLALFCILSIGQYSQAQNYVGYQSSNYAGINSISTNPANIVDSRYAFDLNLVGFDFRLSNNYLGLSTSLFKINNNPFINADSLYNNQFQRFRTDFFEEKSNRRTARLFQNLYLQTPSFYFNVGKNTIGITSALRQSFFFDGLEETTADFILAELKDPNIWNINLDNEQFNAVAAIWSEYGIAYGREILNTGEHYLKGAIHPKLTLAAASTYFYADGLVLNFTNNDTLNVGLADVQFGYSNNLRDSTILTEPYAQNLYNKTNFALDFGFVYEWRPKHKDFVHPRDSSKLVRHKNKYKAKVGLSVTDIGWLKFDRGTFAGNFGGDAVQWDLNTIDIDGIETFGQLMADTFNMTTNREPYRLRLPTCINIQADYNIWKGFYVNMTSQMSFNQNNARLKLHSLNNFSITPRFEHAWFDLALPFSVDGYGNFHSGAGLRLGPLFVGSSDVFNFLLGDNVRGVNVYAGLKVGIPYSKPRQPKEIKLDTNKTEPVKIDSPKIEPVKVDTQKIEPIKIDSPKIEPVKVDTPKIEPVKVDTPKVQIEIKPVKVDTPKIEPVKVDTPKIEPVKVDTSSVRTTDIPENKDRYFYQNRQFKMEPLEIYLADNSVYFATGSNSISAQEKIKLDSLVDILKRIPDANIIAHGHADNVGSSKINERLSQQRAEAVKKYLISKGVDKEKIIIDAFSNGRPAADNSNETGRKLNRRVEIFLIIEEKVEIIKPKGSK